MLLVSPVNEEITLLNMPCKTIYKENVFESDYAFACYYDLEARLPWVDGIKSKSGKTRKAHSCSLSDDPIITNLVLTALDALTKQKYAILGIYVNYYADGTMWAPGHSHAGSHQLVISLGATRTLHIAKKNFQMANGSAIIFGSAHHGVPKEEHVTEGRISIATFMKPVSGNENVALSMG